VGARAQLAGHLRQVLPDTFRVVDTIGDLGVLESPTVAAVQIIRTKLEHAEAQPMGAYLQHFDIWVIEPKTDPDLLEDALDDALDEVLLALDNLPPATWVDATRQMHPSDYHAYKIDALLGTLRED
jgi:hypothetical protein